MFIKKKHVVWVLLLTFFFSFIPTSYIRVSAKDDINIISNTNITVDTAKKWAKSKGATNTFISLADLYWKYAPSHGGVNPAVAYIQAAKETGYGKFGGVINESYHNPCGMKTANGGDDYDPAAHMRFNNWNEGVQAHIDHLALYAGASGYPRTGNTYDPRHFNSIKGKASTVTKLGGNWAPSTTYGSEILSLYRDLEKLEPIGKMLGCIDNPSGETITTDTLLVRGWALNTSGVAKVKIYIDNVLKATIGTGLSRPDVKNAYPTYVNAENSGFSTEINISDLSNGIKTVKVEQIGNDNSVNTITRSITINRVISRMCIDTPAYNSKVNSSQLTVSGWAVNRSNIKSINIYVDGVLKGTTTTGISRPDVKKVYPEFQNADKSGFSKVIDISNVSGGSKKLVVEQVTTNNQKFTSETIIYVNKPIPRTYIDTPVSGANIEGNSLTVSGWSVNNDGINSINIYVDGKLKGTTTTGVARPDVKKVYPEYTSASTSGFSKTIDLSDIDSGIRTIKVEQVSKTGTTSEEVKVKIIKLEPITYIDTPVNNATLSGKNLIVSGWAINNEKVNKVNIYIDGVLKSTTTTGIARPDVKRVYPKYSYAETSGFSSNIDISSIATGKRVLRVEQVTSSGKKYSVETNFIKPQPRTYIDTPVSGESIINKKLTVSGWSVNNDGISAINIYVDGVLKGTTTTGISRPDVKKVYPEYTNSSTSGFSTSIDLTNVAVGKRVIKVEQVSAKGQKTSEETVINVTRPIARMCLDEPINNSTVSSKTFTVKGWALNAEGVKSVDIYVDNKKVKSIPANVSRPDVKNAYPEYNNSNSGFYTNIDLSSIKAGNRTIKVVAVGNDNSQVSKSITIKVIKKEPRSCIDAPTDNYVEQSDNLTVTGWTLNESGVKNINVLIDGVKVSTIGATVSRPDVIVAYPGYQNSSVCGFTTKVNLSGYGKGEHTVSIQTVGYDGSSNTTSRKFYYKENPIKKLVVLDPGHNNGGDEGATIKVGNTTYYERLLNDEIALKTKVSLEEQGYKVIYTRQPFAQEFYSKNESLARRVNIANSLKADIFVSIHQNSYNVESANGTEVFYSSKNADSGYSGPSNYNYKLNTSKQIASNVVNNIVNSVGFTNRGAKDQSLFVCRNTNMPAVLVECGFISNNKDRERLLDQNVQSKIADSIAKGVKSAIG